MMGFRMVVVLILFASLCIADSLNVSYVGCYNTEGTAFSLDLYGDYAFIADHLYGLRIISVEDPSTPYEVGFYNVWQHFYDVVVMGDYAYVANNGGCSLLLLDITDLATPILASSLFVGHYPFAVFVSNGFAYIAVIPDGLRIIDLACPLTPSEVGFYVSEPRDIKVLGNTAYIATGNMQIIDVSDPTSPILIGSFDSGNTVYGIFINDNYAYLAEDDGVLRILDITDAASPIELGSYDVGHCAYNVVVEGDYAYVAGYNSGLRVLSISNPALPTEVGYYNIASGEAYNVLVRGDYAYVAYGEEGLVIFDISYFTGIEENSPTAKPNAFSLFAHPNPFNSAVQIAVDVPSIETQDLASLQIEILDLAGRRVAQLPGGGTVGDGFPVPPANGRGDLAPTNREFIWTPDEFVRSGVYLVRARAGEGQTVTKRIVYLK